MHTVGAMSSWRQTALNAPLDELLRGFVFELRRTAVLGDSDARFREWDDSNFHSETGQVAFRRDLSNQGAELE